MELASKDDKRQLTDAFGGSVTFSSYTIDQGKTQ